ncbi:MAG TPA: hypothetical protein VHZ51_12000 [Ktedonobacteraceae bacterium]|nr:hypothetical protein [Ktedonobacteraceae bacterium]
MSQSLDSSATVEHLAARLPADPPVDPHEPAIRQRLSTIRSEVTRVVTGLRWNGLSIAAASQHLMALLDVGPVPQWQPVLIPLLVEIDRAGNLLPAWFHIIQNSPDPVVAPRENPADSTQGRVRRIALLMLGNYKQPQLARQNEAGSYFWQGASSEDITACTLVDLLGTLATDAASSLYAVQSLLKLDTNAARQALLKALNAAQGWARVDVIEGIIHLNQPHFHDLLLASGLEHAPALESYVTSSLYRAIPLATYLQAETPPHLAQQAARVLAQVLRQSMTPPTPAVASQSSLPIVFERDLAVLAHALFADAQARPTWQNTMALHTLGMLLGRYWEEISRGTIQDQRITESVYACLPMMPEVEQWMATQGRATLYQALEQSEQGVHPPIVETLEELREHEFVEH